jgi:hypothetical protein
MSAKKFKVGDHVKIRRWESMEKEYGLNERGDIRGEIIFGQSMRELCGSTVKIKGVGNYAYDIFGSSYYFSDEMFENPAKEMTDEDNVTDGIQPAEPHNSTSSKSDWKLTMDTQIGTVFSISEGDWERIVIPIAKGTLQPQMDLAKKIMDLVEGKILDPWILCSYQMPEPGEEVIVVRDYKDWGLDKRSMDMATVHRAGEDGQNFGGPNSLTGQGWMPPGTVYFAFPGIGNPESNVCWKRKPEFPIL